MENMASKKIGLAYGGEIKAAIPVRVAATLLVLILLGVTYVLIHRLTRDPLELSAAEKLAIGQAYGALNRKGRQSLDRYNKIPAEIEALPQVKKEREVQSKQNALKAPIQKQIQDATEPLQKQLKPMDDAIAESNKRIDADPEVKKKKDEQAKLLEEVTPERKVFVSILNGLRDARWLPSTCGIDTDTWDKWYKTEPNGDPVKDKDGKMVECKSSK